MQWPKQNYTVSDGRILSFFNELLNNNPLFPPILCKCSYMYHFYFPNSSRRPVLLANPVSPKLNFTRYLQYDSVVHSKIKLFVKSGTVLATETSSMNNQWLNSWTLEVLKLQNIKSWNINKHFDWLLKWLNTFHYF